MPIIELHVIEGYDAATKKRLGDALIDATRLTIPAAPELVTVLIHDLPPENYNRGYMQREPAPAKPDPEKIVRDFLSAMEAREIDKAREALAVDFTMTFPGTGPMQDLQDLIAWAQGRYRFVTKSYEGFDVMQSRGEAAVVYCRGTLSGAWPDGTAFDGIRFIDRFEVVADKITRQEVWNDIAETRMQT